MAVTAARHHQVRDLQWQRRRFVIAVLATALVFGMTLLMTGTDASVHDEGWRIVAALGADAWLVADGASGPFTTSTPIPAAEISGEFNLNGIAATANGKALIVAHSVNEQLYTVDPMWAVQNFSNQVSRIRLRPDLTSGRGGGHH